MTGNSRFHVRHCREVSPALGQHTAVVRLQCGDLLLAYGDLTDQMADQVGYLRRSKDEGRTWSAPELRLKPRCSGGGTHVTLGMQQLADGRILFPWSHGPNLKKQRDAACDFVCLRSDDNGKTWQGWANQDVPFHRVSPYGKIIELPDGTVLCPAWGQVERDDPYAGTTLVLRSRDRGRTWPDHSLITDKHPLGCNETDLTRLPNGRLLALIRTYGLAQDNGPSLHRVHYAFSDDNGHHWSAPEPTNVLGQNMNAWITPQGSLVAACRGIDGTGHLVGSDITDSDPRYSPQEGYGIHFFRAADDGRHWQWEFALPDPDDRSFTAYHEAGEPAFCNLPDGSFLISYYSYKETVIEDLAANPPNDFVAGEIERIPHVFKRRVCICRLDEA